MTKREKQVKDYILGINSFSWCNDIIEHTLWGFKDAPYKTFKRAKNVVQKVINIMEKEGLISIEKHDDSQDTIHIIKRTIFTIG